MSTVTKNDQHSVVPTWVQAKLFESVLKKEVDDYKQIKEFKVSPACAPGENYSTVMLRIEITVEKQDGASKALSFMLKVPHNHEFMKEMRKKFNVFEVEDFMYRQVMPELEQLYIDNGLAVKFSPRSYQLPTNHDYIMLEDLRVRNFKNVNRLAGLDRVHVKAVLLTLAQYHAASAKRIACQGNYPSKYISGFLTELHRPMLEGIYRDTCAVWLECVAEYKGHETYIEDVKNYHNVVVGEFFKLTNVDDSEFNVLNHGDCCITNIMFQYDEAGKLCETYLVDNQLPLYGTPAFDLIYFIFSSAQKEIKIQYFDDFIKFYHDKLIEHLKLLKYPKTLPTLKEIHMALIKYGGCVGYTSVVNVMGAVLLPPSDDAHYSKFVAAGDEAHRFRKLMYLNEKFRKNAEELLPWLHNRGALELN
ncbi:uncharacterized protein LOC129246012 [Anastrepha obliqua]|uniref:uncharacterized protein LOC129246012 n=1 Tax=Anastrepha obliqua TaxID=95512 RepID=UPI0024094BCD|nr:uncharacterized protein LOC129246012 [Anastrepha obliqua]